METPALSKDGGTVARRWRASRRRPENERVELWNSPHDPRKQGRALPGAGSRGGGVAMSWLRAACARPGQDGGADADVFDDEADETLPAQREWRNRLERRVRVRTVPEAL